jgi:hypothetical protein
VNTLYLLGGPPRTAKTTIMSGIAKELGIAFIATDAVVHGLRNVLTGEPHQMLRAIELNGSAEWKVSMKEGDERKPFASKGTESELTVQTIVGMLDYYCRNNDSVAFEGAALTPELVKGFNAPGFSIKAAFVGFTNASHADNVINYAKANPHDWINGWLPTDGEENIRDWIANQIESCIKQKSEAEKLGYPFFDISTMLFEQYVASAQQYFVES